MNFIRCQLVATLFITVILLNAGVARLHAGEFTSGAEQFITSLAAKAETSLLSDNISPIEHRRRFRALMIGNFDLKGVGKWVIGRYWRRVSEPERAKYLSLFERFVVATYSKRFRGYTKAKLQVNGTTKRKNSAFVNSQINRKGSKPIKIIWRVTFLNGKYKITDIIIEGVSWIQTQRSEFVSVIRNNGGKVSGLMKALNKKIIYLTSSTS
jgi:phospholipid transport system substrate-binding protein